MRCLPTHGRELQGQLSRNSQKDTIPSRRAVCSFCCDGRGNCKVQLRDSKIFPPRGGKTRFPTSVVQESHIKFRSRVTRQSRISHHNPWLKKQSSYYHWNSLAAAKLGTKLMSMPSRDWHSSNSGSTNQENLCPTLVLVPTVEAIKNAKITEGRNPQPTKQRPFRSIGTPHIMMRRSRGSKNPALSSARGVTYLRKLAHIDRKVSDA